MEPASTQALSFWQSALWPVACSQFNTREFFECHETLEDLWNQLQPGTEKQLIHGLLQLAVGLHHCQQGNHHGAHTLIEKGFQKLTPLIHEAPFPQLLSHPLLQRIQDLYNTLQSTGSVPPLTELPPLALTFPQA